MKTMPIGAYQISCDPARLDLNLVHGFLSQSYWSPGIPRTVVERALRGSLAFGAYANDQQVGFARVITDRATFAYVADVFVIEEHRGRGVSKLLMQAMIDHPDLQGLRRWSLVTRDAHGLYEQFGFRPVAQPERHMEILRRDIYLASNTEGA